MCTYNVKPGAQARPTTASDAPQTDTVRAFHLDARITSWEIGTKTSKKMLDNCTEPTVLPEKQGIFTWPTNKAYNPLFLLRGYYVSLC